jgi:PucR family transcriptional regulator, purine catabolism regulatory protein
MLTVRELLRGLDVRLVSGEEAIDAPVRWVHISELRDPTTWLSGGEVLLTTGMGLETPEQQREFIGRLADHQLAALGFGVGFGHDEVPAALVQAAAEREFPVFAVPYEVPFIAVTEAAFTQLVNEQYAVLRRALAAHERLERVVLSERGLDALAGTLATLIGAAVLVFDARGEPLVQRAFRRTLEPDEVAALQSELVERRRLGRAFLPSHPGLADRSLALPVAADGAPGNGSDPRGERVPQAWLVAIKDGGGPLSDFDRLTLHQAVTIVALELLRGRVAGDTERRLAGDVLAALVGGELTGAELARRLEPFGLSEGVAAIVVPWEGGPGGSLSRRGRSGGGGPVEDALAQALRDEAAPGLVASTGGLTCGLVPGVEEDELFALAGRVADRLRTTFGAGLSIGVGRPVPGADARRTFHEARCAVEAMAMGSEHSTHNGSPGNGTHAATPPRVATYKDLGSFQLLLSLQEDQALRLFCDSILGPIEASEGHYGGELMRSLEAFIEENGQWERAARRLYCHRHTLRYRIRRVEELTGRDLSSARDRIEFWLALRGRELVA